MKFDAQIEENCRRTISYLQGYHVLPKASVARNWVIRNLRRIQFAMQEELSTTYAECGQDERTSIYQSYCVFALLFSKKNLNQARYSIYGNLLPVFSTGVGFPSSGEIKPPTPVLQPIHFSCKENPCIR